MRVEVALDPASLGAAQDRVAAWLEGQGADAPTAYRARLVIEELLANLMMHGRFGDAPRTARLALRLDAGVLHLVVEDPAAPFDPRQTASPTPPPRLDDDRLGGLGLALVRRMADIRDYARTEDGWNRTELRIRGEGDRTRTTG